MLPAAGGAAAAGDASAEAATETTASTEASAFAASADGGDDDGRQFGDGVSAAHDVMTVDTGVVFAADALA